MRLLWSEDVTPNTFANNEKLGYRVKDLGVYAGFAIVREADGHEMCRDIRSYSEAMRRIRLEYVPLQTVAGGQLAEMPTDTARKTIGASK